MLRPRPAAVMLALLALLLGGTAAARPKKTPKKKAPVTEKVRIETIPAGASVYLGDKESGEAGQTPLDLALTAGEYVLIIELEGHVPLFETIAVETLSGSAAGTTQSFSYELDPATATLVIEAEIGEELPADTVVKVDGEERGAPPIRAEVEVGPHLVEVSAPGRQPYEEWVEVEGGQEHLMSISGAQLGIAAPVDDDKKAKRPAGPIGSAATGVEFGWRRFRYDEPRTANLRPYDADGSVQVVIEVELHPWRRFVASKFLDRLAITGMAGYAPTVVATSMAGDAVNAYWRTQQAGLRFRAAKLPRMAVDVDVGWMHTLYTFRDENNLLVDEVPDVDYHMLRIGARVVGRDAPDGMFEGWIGADNRVVLSAGALEDRFDDASVDGIAVRAGAAAWFLERHLEARVEGSYARFGWKFESEAGDTYDADGGTDALFGITLLVGGRY